MLGVFLVVADNIYLLYTWGMKQTQTITRECKMNTDKIVYVLKTRRTQGNEPEATIYLRKEHKDNIKNINSWANKYYGEQRRIVDHYLMRVNNYSTYGI